MKKFGSFILILALAAFGYYVVVKSTYFSIAEISVVGDGAYRKGEILDLIDVEVGDNLAILDVAEIKHILISKPNIEEVTVKRTFPNLLQISYASRKNVIDIAYLDYYLSIDENLVILEANDEISSDFHVSGYEIDKFIVGKPLRGENPKLIKKIVELVELMHMSDLPTGLEVVVNNDSIELILGSEMKVTFGNGVNMESKFNGFINIYKNLSNNGINTGVIDVSSDGLPVYRPFDE